MTPSVAAIAAALRGRRAPHWWAVMPEIRAVCFDLFHTLVDVAAVPDAVGRFTADVLGVDRAQWNRVCFSDLHEIRRPTVHGDVIEVLARALLAEASAADIAQATRERQRRFDYALTHIEAETIETLQRLRAAGLRLALVSNASTGEVAAWSRSPLAPCFDAAVFSCACGFAKPELQIYQLAAEQLGVDVSRCLFVGDGGSDEHEGAARAGMYPILLTRFVGSRLPADELARRRGYARGEISHVAKLTDLLCTLPVERERA